MKIFIDSAMLEEIKEAISWGVIDGVTTNPSLIRKAVEKQKEMGEDVSLEQYIGEICKVAGKERPVSLEVMSKKKDEMIGEAQTIFKKFNSISRNVVVKIPINTFSNGDATDYEGLMAINKLAGDGIPVNVTLVMTPEQALLAAKAGAAYVSPFAGRIDDCIRQKMEINFKKNDYFDLELVRNISGKLFAHGFKNLTEEKISSLYSDKKLKMTTNTQDGGIASGVDCVRNTVDIFRKYDIKTEVIAASIRNSRQVREVADTCCEICTVPMAVIREMLKHPKTEEGVEKFYADASEAKYDELFT